LAFFNSIRFTFCEGQKVSKEDFDAKVETESIKVLHGFGVNKLSENSGVDFEFIRKSDVDCDLVTHRFDDSMPLKKSAGEISSSSQLMTAFAIWTSIRISFSNR